MKQVRFLFLGASRLVGLLERFRTAAAAEGVELELLSIEDGAPWHAIAAAGLCRVLPGPRFDDPDFGRFLLDVVAGEEVRAVIPTIDPATVAVSRLAGTLREAGILPVVSRSDLCEAMRDKARADALFRSWSVPVPDGGTWPRLAKPRVGSSSRGQVVLQDPEEFAFWSSRHRLEDYVVQPLLRGTEYSVDAFVARDGEVLGAVPRTRMVVSGGEVMVTRTEDNETVLGLANRVLGVPGWYGPVNIQVMDTDTGAYLLEVNPRFGSGVTCALEAGLESPRWILRECLGRPLPRGPVPWRPGLCMTRSRKDYFVWSS